MGYINNNKILLGAVTSYNPESQPEVELTRIFTENGEYVIGDSSQPIHKVNVTVATPNETEEKEVEITTLEDITILPSEGKALSKVDIIMGIQAVRTQETINKIGLHTLVPPQGKYYDEVQVYVTIPTENKVETITQNGEVVFTPSEGEYYDSVTLTVDVQPELEEKEFIISTNGKQEIVPTEGKYFSKVSLDIQVPTNEDLFISMVNRTIVEIPNALLEGLEVIGDYAFYKSALEKITLPDTLTIIGRAAFSGCKNFGKGQTTLIIPASVEEIKEEAFQGCDYIETVRFLGTPEVLANEIFASCKNLKTIQVPWSAAEDAGRNWGVIANIVYNYDS